MFKKAVDRLIRVGEIIDERIIPIDHGVNLEVALRKKNNSRHITIVFSHPGNRVYQALNNDQALHLINALARIRKSRMETKGDLQNTTRKDPKTAGIFNGFKDLIIGEKLATEKVKMYGYAKLTIYLKKRQERIYYILKISAGGTEYHNLESHQVDAFESALADFQSRLMADDNDQQMPETLSD